MDRFQQYIQPTHNLDFALPASRHHRIMQDGLEQLFRGDIKRLMILSPPGSAKSTYTSIRFVTWALANEPTLSILCCSNTTELAEAFNRRRRAVCLTPEWERLSNTTLHADDRGVSRFATAVGGASVAAGVGSTIVGFRSDLNVIDDPHKSFEESQSSVQLQKIYDWYMTEFRSRGGMTWLTS